MNDDEVDVRIRQALTASAVLELLEFRGWTSRDIVLNVLERYRRHPLPAEPVLTTKAHWVHMCGLAIELLSEGTGRPFDEVAGSLAARSYGLPR